jgi:hypothetical protein
LYNIVYCRFCLNTFCSLCTAQTDRRITGVCDTSYTVGGSSTEPLLLLMSVTSLFFKLLFNPYDRPGVGYGLLMVQGLATFVWNE